MSPGRIVRAGAALGAVLAAAAAGRAGLELGVVYLAPALVLFAVLLTRRYPGERHVARLVTRGRSPRRSPAGRPPARPRVTRRRPRGGLLIASALAERGPPPVLLRH